MTELEAAAVAAKLWMELDTVHKLQMSHDYWLNRWTAARTALSAQLVLSGQMFAQTPLSDDENAPLVENVQGVCEDAIHAAKEMAHAYAKLCEAQIALRALHA